ncbi:MAG: hypothetical protein E6P95_01865 [Candidatus Moraniibacteriota bacterium]|nr:MAG: hypothetical protein E6P95_01865 [Candidatus Moranbacteria bacterium]
MDMNQQQSTNTQSPAPNPMEGNTSEPITVSGMDMSTHTVFGVPRRVIGFGFALFVVLLLLAFIYAQFAGKDAMAPGMSEQENPQAMMPVESGSMKNTSETTVTGPVTPDVVVDDLIDEAIADRDDTTSYTDDEISDVEDGSNY